MSKIEDFLRQLLQHLGFVEEKIGLKTTETEDLISVVIEVPDSESGALIGHQGETLNSLQRLVRIIFREQIDKKIQLDVNQYRQEKEAALKEMIDRIAAEVKSTKKSVEIKKTLSSYERFLIHQYIADGEDFADLESVSHGEGLNRRLVIKLK